MSCHKCKCQKRNKYLSLSFEYLQEPEIYIYFDSCDFLNATRSLPYHMYNKRVGARGALPYLVVGSGHLSCRN